MITTAQPQTPEISTVDALWTLIQSLTRAFEELHAGKVHHDARNLFKK